MWVLFNKALKGAWGHGDGGRVACARGAVHNLRGHLIVVKRRVDVLHGWRPVWTALVAAEQHRKLPGHRVVPQQHPLLEPLLLAVAQPHLGAAEGLVGFTCRLRLERQRGGRDVRRACPSGDLWPHQHRLADSSVRGRLDGLWQVQRSAGPDVRLPRQRRRAPGGVLEGVLEVVVPIRSARGEVRPEPRGHAILRERVARHLKAVVEDEGVVAVGLERLADAPAALHLQRLRVVVRPAPVVRLPVRRDPGGAVVPVEALPQDSAALAVRVRLQVGWAAVGAGRFKGPSTSSSRASMTEVRSPAQRGNTGVRPGRSEGPRHSSAPPERVANGRQLPERDDHHDSRR
mmetsp:Transcript_4698/g.12104  ORF Transcript_4698/g.12104 Transcript_4698/m.12104 type:complete len:345 (+) Transcript_4698:514-1548(+)